MDTISAEKKKVSPSPVKRGISPLKERKRQIASQILGNRLGAVALGYKTRRIFTCNRVIVQLRTEFRDLIQFAYQLKQESVHYGQKLNNRKLRPDKAEALRVRHEQTRKLLLQSLKDLIQKRVQF